MTDMTRRSLLLTSLALPLAAAPARSKPTLCAFSKHLAHFPDYQELAKKTRELGFEGVDLTVREKGHVLPERAAADLPSAVSAIQAQSLQVPMITTNLRSAQEPAARPILQTASRLGVPFYKLGYFNYRNREIEPVLAETKQAMQGLVALGREHNIVAGFHNHSGDYVGTSVWDIRDIISNLDPRWIGYYFDPCHATAEGGVAGWHIALRLAAPRLKMVAIKDFYWEKQQGKWRMRFCPLGQGMVDWPRFCTMLHAARFTGPITIHTEYETRDEAEALGTDLAFLREQLDRVYV